MYMYVPPFPQGKQILAGVEARVYWWIRLSRWSCATLLDARWVQVFGFGLVYSGFVGRRARQVRAFEFAGFGSFRWGAL